MNKNMNKKVNIVLLACALFISGFFWTQSCSRYDKKSQKSETATSNKKSLDDRKNETYTRVYDYMLNVNGYHSYVAQLDSVRPKWLDEMDVNAIKSEYTLGGTMTRRVENDGKKIIDKSYADIVALLAKHNLSLDNKILSDTDGFSIDNGDSTLTYCHKPSMAYVGIVTPDSNDSVGNTFWNVRETYGAFNEIMSAINGIIDASNQDVATKQNLKASVLATFDKTKRDLEKNRHSIEREYSDYYLLDEYSRETLGLDNFTFGYYALDNEYVNGKYANTRRYTSIYNPFLPREFYEDSTAKYKLVHVKGNKWCIEKHLPNGQIEKSKFFHGHATTATYTKVAQTPDNRKDTNFEFEADSLLGGRIFFDEVVDIKMRKKDWTPNIPQHAQKTIDSLNTEFARKQNLSELATQKAKEADSVAKQVVAERFPDNQR